MPPLQRGNTSIFSSDVCDAQEVNVNGVCNIVHLGEAWSFCTSSLSEWQRLEALC